MAERPAGGASRVVAILEEAVSLASAVSIFAVMLIVCADVAMRYLFNDPISWAFDLISLYVMVAIFYLTLSPSYAGDHHIRIDILVRGASARRALWLRRVQILLIAPVFCVIAWLSYNESATAFVEGQVASGPIPWPRWPVNALVCLGSVLLVCRMALEFAFGPARHDPAG